jgi:hypothetical protein
MRRIVRSIVIGWMLAAGLASTAMAGKLPSTFVNVYRPAVARLQQGYAQLTAEGTIFVDSPITDQACEQRFILRNDGNRRRLDLRTLAQRNMGLKVGASTMKMATPIGSLSTYTNPGSKFFDNARQLKYDGVIEDINNSCLLYLPYSFGTGGTILDTLLSPAVTVKNVQWIRTDGQAMVQVTYDERGQYAGQSGLWNSTIVLSPDDGWALRRFDRSLAGGSKLVQRGELSYSGLEGGVPIVQLIRVETRQNGQIVRQESVTISQFDLGPPDGEYFTSFEF